MGGRSESSRTRAGSSSGRVLKNRWPFTFSARIVMSKMDSFLMNNPIVTQRGLAASFKLPGLTAVITTCSEIFALLCCESLELEGADYCRGYLQTWLYQGDGSDASAIPEKSAQKIFRAADQILRAGRPSSERSAEYAH